MQDITRQLFDVTTEVNEAAKLAEEYYSKTVECSDRVQSCVRQIGDLNGQLSSFNSQLAVSAKQSLGVIRSSIDSLLLAERTSRPIDSIVSAIHEVQQLKTEHLQLSQRFDGLLAFLQTCSPQASVNAQHANARQLLHQDIADDIEPISDEVVPQTGNRSERRKNTSKRISSASNASSSTAVAPLAANGQCSSNDVVMSVAVGTIVSSSSSLRRRGSAQQNVSGAARCARSRSSAGRVNAAVPHGTGESTGIVRQSSVMKSRGAAKSSTGTPQALIPTTSPAPVSLDGGVPSAAADFKKPPARSRGRMQTRPYANIRAKSVDGAVRSSSAASTVHATRSFGRSRSKFTVQRRGAGSHVTTALSEASAGDEGKKVPSRRGQKPRRSQSAAGGEIADTAESFQRQSYSPRTSFTAENDGKGTSSSVPVAKAMQSQSLPDVDTSSRLPVTAATSPSSSHPVTTWLSGPRTDIFGQKSLQLSASATQVSNTDTLPSNSSHDNEVSFKQAAPVHTSTPLVTGRYIFIAIQWTYFILYKPWIVG